MDNIKLLTVLSEEQLARARLEAVHFPEVIRDPSGWRDTRSQYPECEYLCHWMLFSVRGTRLGNIVIGQVGDDEWMRFRGNDSRICGRKFLIVLSGSCDITSGIERMVADTGQVIYINNTIEYSVKSRGSCQFIMANIDIDVIDEQHESTVNLPVQPQEQKYYPKGIVYRTELLRDVLPELLPFVPVHWAELGLTKDQVPVDMDWERYLEMERTGRLHLLVVRDNGVVIGYQFTFVGGHFHYRSTCHGMVDLYYLDKKYRKGRTGINMIKAAESELKKLGVVKIITGTKMHLNMSRLFEYLGYTHSDQTYIKIL